VITADGARTWHVADGALAITYVRRYKRFRSFLDVVVPTAAAAQARGADGGAGEGEGAGSRPEPEPESRFGGRGRGEGAGAADAELCFAAADVAVSLGAAC
jgi:hypothetical protein